MLLFFNADGRLFGSDTMSPYPAPAEALERTAVDGGTVIDVPPFEPAYWHVMDGELRIRPRMTIGEEQTPGDAGALLTLTGIPAGTSVTIDGPFGGALVSDGSPVELEFLLPGEYRVAVSLEPYQPHVITVQATGRES